MLLLQPRRLLSNFLSFSLSLSHLEKVFKVGLVVDAGLQQHGSVDLRGAEVDVGLHVRELGSQDVPNHLHRHVVPAHLFSSMQRPATQAHVAAAQLRADEQDPTPNFESCYP